MVKKILKKAYWRRLKRSFGLVLGVVLLAYVFFCLLHFNKITSGVYFGQEKLSGKSRVEALAIVSTSIERFKANKQIVFKAGSKEIDGSIEDLGIKFDAQATADSAYSLGRSQNFFGDQFSKIKSTVFVTRFTPKYTVDSEKFNAFLDEQFALVEKPAKDASIVLVGNKPIVQVGSDGVIVDRVKLANDLQNEINSLSSLPIELSYVVDNQRVDVNTASVALDLANPILGQTIIFSYKYDQWLISGPKLFELFRFEPAGSNNNLAQVKIGESTVSVRVENKKPGVDSELRLVLNDDKINDLISQISKLVNQPTQDATLEFDGTKVTKFLPAQDGQELNANLTKQMLLAKIAGGNLGKSAKINIDLPVQVAHAKIANAQVNALGIRELLASGVSYFAGSIPNRVDNIALGSSFINGTIVKPGDIFSFNAIVGPVSAEQGFKQAYVIQKGRTVLDDGGGICQVSTTVFRAILNAGLPVVKRTAHAYRVGYYEQHGFKPGFDATIFSPSVDFQFKNDTLNHLLLQVRVDRANAKLQIDIYGTGDGRRVEISDAVVSNVKGAPEPLRQDDPSLPKGTVKQVDFAAAGATSVFTRRVYKGDNLIIDDTFKSNFRPWQAVYLVGTGG